MNADRGTALVTGAGSGIGRAVALRLASDGVRVGCMGQSLDKLRETESAVRGQGGTGLAVVADVTRREQVRPAIDAAASQLGPITMLVNSAGRGKSAPFAKMDDSLWDEMLAVNLTGVYNVTRAVVPGMIAAGGGRIVNIASVAGLKGYPYIAAYVAAKHGVVGLTRAIAVELAGKNITVNAVCPGYVDTPMTEQTLRNIADKTGRSIDECRREIEAMSPQNRLFTPEEIAATVAYLLSPQAAGINGQAIAVCGGELAQ